MVGSVLHTQIRHNLPAMINRNLILGVQTRSHQKPYDHLKYFTLTITVMAFKIKLIELVVNPITVDSFGFLFNSTTVV